MRGAGFLGASHSFAFLCCCGLIEYPPQELATVGGQIKRVLQSGIARMIQNDTLTQSVLQLRRLARLLAGHQGSGDAVVAATLETLADGDEEDLGVDARIAL